MKACNYSACCTGLDSPRDTALEVRVGLAAKCLVFLSTVLAARSWTEWLEFSLFAVLAL